MNFDRGEVIAALEEDELQASQEADLLFGHCNCTEAQRCKKCDPPEDEAEIIFAADLSLEEKLAKLQVLRGKAKRVTCIDEFRVRGASV